MEGSTDTPASLPRVSVVIPLFNARTTVLRAAESALAQQGVIPEVIVVDDGSTDGSAEALESLRERIRIVGQLNTGPGAARNRGMKDATGDYIAFLDADDYWLQGFLRATTGFLQEHPECGAVSTAYYRLEDGNYFLKPGVLTFSPERLPTGVIGDFFLTYAEFWHVWTGVVVLRHSLAETAGLVRSDLAFAEDMEYWLRLATVTSWGFIAEPHAVYDRSSPTSLSSTWQKGRLLPDLELWQSAILPRLTSDNRGSYELFRSAWVRGLITRLMLAGEVDQARQVSRKGFVVRQGRYGLSAKLLRHTPLWFARGISGIMRYQTAHQKERGRAIQLPARQSGEGSPKIEPASGRSLSNGGTPTLK